MRDPHRGAKILCLAMAIGFLAAGSAVLMAAPEGWGVSLLFCLLALVALVRLCLYPRTFHRCSVCGQRVPNEVHLMIAHANGHIRRRDI